MHYNWNKGEITLIKAKKLERQIEITQIRRQKTAKVKCEITPIKA